MLARLDELDEALAAARGRYPSPARERVELLLDRDAPFLELCPVAGWGSDETPGAGIVGGIGRVEGAECVLLATGPAASGALAVAKTRRLAAIAAENRLPLIQLLDGAGPGSDDGGYAALRDLAHAGTGGLPSIAVVLGGEVTGAAAMAGYTVAVGRGPADFVAEDGRDAVRLARLCVRRLDLPLASRPPRGLLSPPKYEPEELLGLAAADPREILARILDGSGFDEYQPGTGPLAGWGELHGYPVAVLAGDAGADKAARFVRRAGVPILVLDTGGARFAEALATAEVPHLTVEFGAGAGRAYQPRFLFRWPHPTALDRSGRLHDDGVIDPRDTRTALGIALAAVHNGVSR